MTLSLHRAKFSWGRTHIEIECAKGEGGPLGEGHGVPDLTAGAVAVDDADSQGAPAMCWRGDAPVLFERFQLRENTDYYLDVTLPLSLSDAETLRQGRTGWPFSDRLSTVFRADPARRWRANDDGTITVPGQLRTGNHAGILDLSLDGGPSFCAEIVCRKIGYLDEFRALLDAVADEYAELLLQYDSPVSAAFNLTDMTSEHEAALLFQLRHIMADHNLPVALDEVRRGFHVRLEGHLTSLATESVEQPDLDALISELDTSQLIRGGPFADLLRGYSPRELPVRELRETSDTPENRFVKYFLEELRLIAHRLVASLAKARRRASLREVQSWLLRLDEELASSLWRSVGQLQAFPANSQLLQKRSGYREVLQFDLSLRMSFELPWKRAESLSQGMVGDLRPVSELYEYWCFFVLRRVLLSLGTAELSSEDALVEATLGGFSLRLLRGVRSKISVSYKHTDGSNLALNLYYNRSFQRKSSSTDAWEGSYTANFHPDYSIEIVIKREGGVERHWLHFDAKYRLEKLDLSVIEDFDVEVDSSLDEDGLTYEEELARVHKRDDLFKMHAYRDGILSSRGAYIVFPGDGTKTMLGGPRQNLFVRHPSALGSIPSYLIPSVGAFGLSPGQDGRQEAALKAFILQAISSIAERHPYVEEQGVFT